MTSANITIAVSADFFTAFSAIPRRQHGKVLTFINKFRTCPELPGYNYEKITEAQDKRLRSVRIDDTYRCILLKPDMGTVYMLLWVAHHDDAYAWVRKRICTVNPETGGLQIVMAPTEKQTETNIEQKYTDTATENFPDDVTLTRLGIEPKLWEDVRTLYANADLASLKERISSLSYEALQFLQSGEPAADVLELYDSCKNENATLPSEDLATALQNPFSRQFFMVDPGEKELAAMLDAPLEHWRVFLHPSQRRLVERDWNGPVRVLGGAGTGKTVVALHRARWLARHCSDDQKILFTTFNRTLAVDIQRQLSSLCSPDILSRIEVVNLDKWVTDFLRRHAYQYTIDYGDVSRNFWEKARRALPEGSMLSSLPDIFFLEEWKYVIQPQEIMTLAEYCTAQRVGRRQKLTRKERKELWPVFEDFRLLMDEARLRQPADAMREARELLETEGRCPYHAVITDEAQDMNRQAFRLLRALVPAGKNDLFIAGDSHQRIYGQPVTLSSCGITITGRSRKLRINYRTTEEIRQVATLFLHSMNVDDLDGGQDIGSCVSLMHGEKPTQLAAVTRTVLYERIAQAIHELGLHQIDDNSICIVARTNHEIAECKAVLESNEISTYPLSADRSDNREAAGIRMATMHRVKGLEFDVVFLLENDEVIDEDKIVKEHALRYVAASRARSLLFICELKNNN